MTHAFGAPRHIVLVGFMGTGKSTVSRLLAEQIGCLAVDMDAEIERRIGRDIPSIFAQEGEAFFRRVESEVLAALLASEDSSIIATGGGAVLAQSNCDLMLKQGMVVALTAQPEHIIARVRGDENRPLLQGDVEERVNKLLADRKHAYAFAPLQIDTTALEAQAVADLIAEQWKATVR
nr:shikimate kinase [Paenibacillus phyllosphaerae]